MSEKFTKTAVLTGGGTAGHCIPALAVAEKSRRTVYAFTRNFGCAPGS